MKHNYIVDTKLLAYYLEQRRDTPLNIFNKIAELLIQHPKGDIYLVFDVGKSMFRESVYPEYKQHRRAQLSKKTVEEQEQHKRFNILYHKLIKIAKRLNVTVLAVDGVEADDLASLLCEHFRKMPDQRVTLVTGDFDWVHMVVENPYARMLDVNKGELLYRKDVVEKYGLDTRRKFSVLKSIVGDASDNIKFVRNLGEIKGKAIFEKVYKTYVEPTDENVIEEVKKLMATNERFVVHEYHRQDAEDIVTNAFLTNLSIADPFTTFEHMTEAQVHGYMSCLQHDTTPISLDEFFTLTIEELGVPIILTEEAQRIFNVR